MSWPLAPCPKVTGRKPRANVLILGDDISKGHAKKSAHKDWTTVRYQIPHCPATEPEHNKTGSLHVEGRLAHGAFGSGHDFQGNGYSGW